MSSGRFAIRASRAVALALASALALGCQGTARLPDAPPPVELEPVTALAGYGMELRLWALDATSWRRVQDNAEFARLYKQWQAIEAQRATEAQDDSEVPQARPTTTDADGALGSRTAGPPLISQDDDYESFEAYVRAHHLDAPTRPGAEMLSEYLDLRGAIDPDAAAIWERNGFQIALVPLGTVVQLRDAMGVPGPLERIWWGAISQWSHLAKGAAAPNRHLETDMGPLVLGAGRMGLIGRAWPAPGVSAPVLRLEICPQFLPLRSESSRLESQWSARLEADARPADALDEGPVFERLLLDASIPRGYVLLIAPAEKTSQAPGIGPSVPRQTLAESLLTAIGPDGALRPVALVVVPVLPERFSLDGR